VAVGGSSRNLSLNGNRATSILSAALAFAAIHSSANAVQLVDAISVSRLFRMGFPAQTGRRLSAIQPRSIDRSKACFLSQRRKRSTKVMLAKVIFHRGTSSTKQDSISSPLSFSGIHIITTLRSRLERSTSASFTRLGYRSRDSAKWSLKRRGMSIFVNDRTTNRAHRAHRAHHATRIVLDSVQFLHYARRNDIRLALVISRKS